MIRLVWTICKGPWAVWQRSGTAWAFAWNSVLQIVQNLRVCSDRRRRKLVSNEKSILLFTICWTSVTEGGLPYHLWRQCDHWELMAKSTSMCKVGLGMRMYWIGEWKKIIRGRSVIVAYLCHQSVPVAIQWLSCHRISGANWHFFSAAIATALIFWLAFLLIWHAVWLSHMPHGQGIHSVETSLKVG